MKTLNLIFCVLLFTVGCQSQNHSEKAKKNIRAILNAIKNDNRDIMYSLLDTSILFQVQSKEQLDSNIVHAREAFSKCGTDFNKINIVDMGESGNYTVYKCSFCKDNSRKLPDESFDIEFSIPVYETKSLIHYINFIFFSDIKMRKIEGPSMK